MSEKSPIDVKTETTSLKKDLKKKLSLTDKKLKSLIQLKIDEYNGLINEIGALKILAKEHGLIVELTPTQKPIEEKTSWESVGSIDLNTNLIDCTVKGYEYLSTFNISDQALKAIFQKDYEWILIGEHTQNKTERGAGVFLRLSKSGKAFIFFVGKRVFSISIQAWQTNANRKCPISTPNVVE